MNSLITRLNVKALKGQQLPRDQLCHILGPQTQWIQLGMAIHPQMAQCMTWTWFENQGFRTYLRMETRH